MAVIGGSRSNRSKQARLTEILEMFPRVFCFPKSRINERSGNSLVQFVELLFSISLASVNVVPQIVFALQSAESLLD